jgi:hypothetical protein
MLNTQAITNALEAIDQNKTQYFHQHPAHEQWTYDDDTDKFPFPVYPWIPMPYLSNQDTE